MLIYKQARKLILYLKYMVAAQTNILPDSQVWQELALIDKGKLTQLIIISNALPA